MTSSPPRTRPPHVADERTQLMGWYDLQRAIVHYKCEGLGHDDLHRSVLPDSPLMTVAGVLSHLRWAEQRWFEVIFAGGPAGAPQFVDDPEEAMIVDRAVPLDQLLAEYDRQCAASNDIIAAHALDDVGSHPDFAAARATLRWIVLHMLEETARHVGHLDTIRELLDGEKGYY